MKEETTFAELGKIIEQRTKNIYATTPAGLLGPNIFKCVDRVKRIEFITHKLILVKVSVYFVIIIYL
jgi:hypothetical protein